MVEVIFKGKLFPWEVAIIFSFAVLQTRMMSLSVNLLPYTTVSPLVEKSRSCGAWV